MRIIVDAFGGDNAPGEIVKGALMARDEYGVSIVFTGDAQKIEDCMREQGLSDENTEIINCTDVISMHDEPTSVLKEHSESSMAVGLKTLAADGGDCFVTAGSTGAALVGATMLVKRIRGIKRPAIATVLPTATGSVMLLDSGANAECRAEMLAQFGVMGSIYMKEIMGVKEPRVGLANNGAEETKGTPLQLEAYGLLKQAPINFIGNVEGRDIPLGECDVCVCDGFTGNIILKLTEGLAKFFSKELKTIFYKNALSKLAALLVKGGIDGFKKKMDYSEYGGAPLLGIAKPVIKAHGSSDAKAIKNAVRQAVEFCGCKITEKIEMSI